MYCFVASITLRPLTEADFSIADPIVMAAYGSQASMLPDLQRYLRAQSDGWFMAYLDGEPVGLGGAVQYDRFARIGLMSVHPDVQGQGIGTALMRHLLAWIEGHGCEVTLLDARGGAVSLYRKFGFVEDTQAVVYVQQSSPIQPLTAEPARFSERDLPAVASYDEQRFGAARSRVLAGYLAESPQPAFLVRNEQGVISGYLIAQESRLGPWLADTADVAEQVLLQALSLPLARPLYVLSFAEHQEAHALLTRQGFSAGRTLQRMRRGGTASMHNIRWIYGMSSFMFG